MDIAVDQSGSRCGYEEPTSRSTGQADHVAAGSRAVALRKTCYRRSKMAGGVPAKGPLASRLRRVPTFENDASYPGGSRSSHASALSFSGLQATPPSRCGLGTVACFGGSLRWAGGAIRQAAASACGNGPLHSSVPSLPPYRHMGLARGQEAV